MAEVSGRHLKDLGEGIKVLAEAIRIGADIIEGMKVAAIAEFAAFVAQTAAVAAESVATLGLGAGAEAAVVETTREVVKGIYDQAIAQISRQLKQAMTAPVLSTLTSAAENLGEQLLGDALGENLDDYTGAVPSWCGEQHEDPYQAVSDRLLATGPGSAAIVHVARQKRTLPDGSEKYAGGHAFNACNVNGQVVWVDMQLNIVSDAPIHQNAAAVWATVLNVQEKAV